MNNQTSPLCFIVIEAAEYSRISRALLYSPVGSRIETVKIGALKIAHAAELERFLDKHQAA